MMGEVETQVRAETQDKERSKMQVTNEGLAWDKGQGISPIIETT